MNGLLEVFHGLLEFFLTLAKFFGSSEECSEVFVGLLGGLVGSRRLVGCVVLYDLITSMTTR